MTGYSQTFQIQGMDFTHAGEASIALKNILKDIGAAQDLIRKVAIAAYEAEMNVVVHGGGGTMTLEMDSERIRITVEDQGEGIADIELAMREGWSTASEEVRALGFGAGMGLPNIKKNSDELIIESRKGRGTTLIILFDSGWSAQRQ